MTGNLGYFSTLDHRITGKVKFEDDSRIDIKGKGSIFFKTKNGERRVLSDVYFIPKLRSNIISLGQATELGCEVRMKEDHLFLYDRDNKLLVKAKRARNILYKVVREAENIKCLQLMHLKESTKWHARLGHVGLENLKLMVNKKLVTGLPAFEVEKETCGSCLRGKQVRKSFPHASSFRATSVMELIHGDLCGPITPQTAGRNRYVFVLIDDHSRYMWTILMKEKSEAFTKFKLFKAVVEQESGASIKTFRTDRGGEFTSHEFQDFCKKEGIKRHLTAPYSPQQNGVVERRNKTLLEMTLSILKHLDVPNWLWGEAVRHATYLINRLATRTLHQQVPYESYKGKKPNVDHLRVFGCICYVKVNIPHLKKLDDRTRMLVHLGTEPGSKAYRLLDPTSRKIVVSRDVVFDEERGWKWDETQKPSNNGSSTLSFNYYLGDQGTRVNTDGAEEVKMTLTRPKKKRLVMKRIQRIRQWS